MDRISTLIKRELSDIYPAGEVNALVRIIWCEMLGMDMLDIYMSKDINLSADLQLKLENILSRLKRHEPIQYIQGFAPFCGREFGVAPGVLIPRPETEELVELIASDYKGQKPDVVDMGTGSGCIAISLALMIPGARVTAWDISDEALQIAHANNEKLAAGVNIIKRDILAPQVDDSLRERCDVIVSNPPYVTCSERDEMESNVLEWEPHLALFVDDADPLLFYRTIAQHGQTMLRRGGRIYFEINRAYGRETAAMLNNLEYQDIKIIKDFYGNDRIVTALHK